MRKYCIASTNVSREFAKSKRDCTSLLLSAISFMNFNEQGVFLDFEA